MTDRATNLDPELAKRVANLQVRVRRAVDGVMSGLHRSPHRGASVVFVEHEEYRPGDDLRRIDWRASARRDRTVLKRFEQESSLRAWMVVDASGSMHFRGKKSEQTKYEHAATLAAALTHLLLRQGDGVSLVVADEEVRTFLPSRSTVSQLDAVLEGLAAAPRARTGTNLGRVFDDIIERIGRRGLVVLLSDFVDVPPATLHSLHHFVARGHDVWLVHVLSREELAFPYTGAVRFEGREQDQTLDVDADGARKAYLLAVDEWLRECATEAASIGARYVLAPTDQQAEGTLAALLEHRRSRRVS